MHIHNMGRCRGGEKLYMLLRIDGCSPDSISVSAVARDTGSSLPAFHVVLASDGTTCEAVVVLFDTDIDQVLRIGKDGEVAAEKIIRPQIFSLASKFNGRFR